MDRAAPGRSSLGADGVLGRGDEERPGDEGDGHDGQVDGEDLVPAEVVHQEPADQRAEGHAQAGHAGPDADGPAPFLGREHVGQDGQRGGHDERAADAHEGPGGDELVGVLGQGGQARAEGEDHQAHLQGALAAEPVAQAAGGQEEPGEHQGVAVDDPLELAVGGVEVPHERGEGHVEDGVVQGDHDQGQAQDQQDPPPSSVGQFGGHGRAPVGGAGGVGLRSNYETSASGNVQYFADDRVSEVV